MQKILNGPSASSIRSHPEMILYTLIYGVLFLINPTFALGMSFIVLIVTPNPTKAQYYTFYIMLACWLGVLNMTKQLFSDQIAYTDMYVRGLKSNLWESIETYRSKDFFGYREILFNVYSVFCNLLTGANPRAYYFILTVNVYLLHFIAIHKVLFASGRIKYEVICSVVFLAFFNPFFLQSVHAVRQMLATAFVVYAIAYRTVEGKQNYLFLAIALFIHNSTIFFIALALLPSLYKILKKNQIAFFAIAMVLFSVFHVQIGMAMNFFEMGTLSSVGRRLISADSSTEKEALSVWGFVVYAVPTLVASVAILRRAYKTGRFSAQCTFCYLSILTMLLIILFPSAPVIQYRYMIYLYSFVPFVLLTPGSLKDRWQTAYTYFVTAFFVYRFFFVDVNWDKFAAFDEILLSTFPHFWTTPYF